jgi:hypothetical protein
MVNQNLCEVDDIRSYTDSFKTLIIMVEALCYKPEGSGFESL